MNTIRDEYKLAGEIYIRCPFCGERTNLFVRKKTTKDNHGETSDMFSLNCARCRLYFGVNGNGEPIYETESDLIAAWNVRKY